MVCGPSVMLDLVHTVLDFMLGAEGVLGEAPFLSVPHKSHGQSSFEGEYMGIP